LCISRKSGEGGVQIVRETPKAYKAAFAIKKSNKKALPDTGKAQQD